MGNEQSSDGAAPAASSVLTVNTDSDDVAEERKGVARLESLPDVRPLVVQRNNSEATSAMLPAVMASLLSIKSANPNPGLGFDDHDVLKAMDGLALTGNDEQLVREQEKLIKHIEETMRDLKYVRVTEENTFILSQAIFKSLHQMDRLLITIADMSEEVEEIGEMLKEITARFPDGDPLKSFSDFVESKKSQDDSGGRAEGDRNVLPP
mmetsp:Transcript_4302/g.18333  ORF Transcript_4302/g.18333 Transcript_4302/m.18333 type:complete len:208 (-) Transcript_4302:2673-3296(-)|eukprot:CAMPEP_0113969662 /NCGR_PEP_ID=MMETSP0011_2-20120614/10501_1 /TAXON_ID=101924 /ORGANISM="Rhodosorus marinus" /LENGTH=207 /DNA_ID=CAMNT_0000983463 /DNA_START=176 /DNA_END=799 /DNA_ORIENTATION=+ /assembly_acc=CAM_ASM_000156